MSATLVTPPGASNVREQLRDEEFALAVNVAMASVLTLLTKAEKVAVVLPAATVTVVGIVIAGLFTERASTVPPEGAAALSVTVQVAVPAALKLAGLQLREATVTATGAVNAMEAVRLTEFAVAVTVAVLPVVTVPAVAAKVAAVAPDATVTEAGTVRLVLLSDIVTACPPDGAALVKVTVQVLAAPEARLVGLQLKEEGDAGATNVSARVADVELAVAVMTAVASVATALTEAENVAVVEPATTVTDEGSATEVLLSERVTAVPPVGAATDRVTVQVEVPAALKLEGEQFRELTVGSAFALRVMEAVRLTEFAVAVTVAVLPVVMVPAVAEKVAVVAPGATVTEAGTVKVVLLSEIASAKPPDGAALVRVTVQVLVAPEARLEGLQLSAEGVAGATKVSVLVAEVELAVAVTTAVASAVTALTVAANVAVVEPAATVTDAGTETDALLSESVTAVPPVGATTDKVTVQLDVPAALKEVGVQLRELTVGTTGAVRAMEAVRLTEFAAAVTVAVLPVVMVPAVAEKVAVVAPDATVTEAGTVRLALLSESVTA